MPSRQGGLGVSRLVTSVGATTIASTGTGPWIVFQRSWSKWALQVRKNSTATSNFNFKIQAALSTASTSPETIITYTQANVNTVVVSTGGKPYNCVRWRSTALVGATKKLHAFLTGIP